MQETDDQALLTALLEAALDGIVIANSTGTILRANKQAAQLFGRTVAELVGSHISLLMPADVASHHQDYMEHHLETGIIKVLGPRRPVDGRRADGSIFPLQVALAKATIGGKMVFVATMHDLTRRHAAEEAAARAQRMDAIGRMTGGIAHDFNNLLTAVIGNLELLDSSLAPEKSEQLIADALDAAELCADLTSRLVNYARKRPVHIERVDLNDAVTRALGLLRHTLSARCHVEYSAGDTLWPVELDPSQLQTAILNLALNAQDAMAQGGRIFIETRNVDVDDAYLAQELDVAPGRYVRLSISDTGEGMTKEQRALALEPFFTTKPVGEGTGLGLPMVYGFTKQSGGHLMLYSEPGQGTTVSLYLPMADVSGRVSEHETRASITPDGTGKTILVVEDDPRLRRLSERRLLAMGFACLTAPDADAAWRMIDEGAPIDLVFTDMVMPGTKSGYDLARRVAENRPDLAVLLTSGFSENVLRETGQTDGFSMLRKPYRQADLAEAVYAALASEDVDPP